MAIENPSAFPLNPENVSTPGAFCPEPGMTLRDWFAGQALAGLSSATGEDGTWSTNPREAAHYAFAYADAMLAARAEGR